MEYFTGGGLGEACDDRDHMTELGITGIANAKLIGHAPGASVYAATQADVTNQVAIKVLRRLVKTAAQKEAFAKQIEALRRARDVDGVVPILGGGITVHGEPYLVLPLLAGSAQDWLDERGSLDPAEAVALIHDAARAVASLHERGLLHLNLKPSNLLFDQRAIVLLADVGVSLLAGSNPTSNSWLDGSPVWAAPESFSSDRPSARTDVYGLGACLLALISGHAPFPTAGATNPLQLIDRIRSEEPPALATLEAPQNVVTAIRQAMFKDPAARPASALEFAALLGETEPGQRSTPRNARIAHKRASEPSPNDQTLSLLKAAAQAARKHGRSDLVGDIERCRTRLGGLASTVVVLGEHNKGKSTLINALLASQVCRVDAVHATSVTTLVSYAPSASASIRRVGDDGSTRQRISVAEAVEHQTTPADSLDQVIADVAISLPAPLLEAGLRLVDTAPTGSFDSADTRAGRMLTEGAAAIVLVVDASRELTETDLELIAALHSDLTPVTCVMTKIDFYPRWRDVAQRSRLHLARSAPGVELLTVSSTLRIEGVLRDDQTLIDESGFARLIETLAKITNSDSLGVRTTHAHNVAHDAATSMLVALEVERDALANPSTQRDLESQAVDAQQRVEVLRSASSRWGTVLSDGISDLSSAVDLQIRTRLRAAIADIEETIESTDPGETGDELLPEIEARFMAEVAEIQDLIESEATALAGQVAQVFDAEADIAALNIPDGERVFGQVSQRDIEITPAAGRGAALFTGLRGSYSGIAIFGMAGGLLAPVLGAVLLGPLSLVAGAVFGRKVAADERKRQLGARRSEARAAVRRYGDEATLHISKHCRDALQLVQRSLRDENLARASMLAETAAAARDAAAAAVRHEQSDVDQRRTELDAHIEELRVIARAATSTPTSVLGSP